MPRSLKAVQPPKIKTRGENLVRQVVAVLDKPVPEWIVEAHRRGLRLAVLPQQE